MNAKCMLMMAVAGAGAVAVAVDVSDNPGQVTVSESTGFTAATVDATGLPEGLPTPIFWFDCQNRTGWEYADNRVTKIPTLVTGSDRYLTAGAPEHSSKWQVTGAALVENDPEINGAYLDFGEMVWGTSSYAGFLFNPVEIDDQGTKRNWLTGIRTVIAVYGSQNGGGWFLAGGGDGSTWTNYGWERYDATSAKYLTELAYSYPIAHAKDTPTLYRSGVMRQDGIPTLLTKVGMSGGWSTLTWTGETTSGSMNATGVGANDTRPNFNTAYMHGGGMRIAEMIFFDTQLTPDVCAKVEAFLKKKWFGRADRGYNGNAAIGEIRAYVAKQDARSMRRIGIEAGEGETLSVGRIYGGRDSYANSNPPCGIDKTGAGTFGIGDLGDYSGEVRVKAGSLAFERRAVPAALPARFAARFDASDATKVTTDADGRVTAWQASETFDGGEVTLVQRGGNALPALRANAFGAGKPTVDFGPFVSNGGAMKFTSGGADKTVAGITTLIAVIGVQEGGGHYLEGGYFGRKTGSVRYYDPMASNFTLNSGKATPFGTAESGLIFLDGIKRAYTEGFDHPGYHVLALQLAGGSDVTALGTSGDGIPSGGMRFSEVVLYNRILAEEELRDASAYLMDKWMGRAAPGYAATADKGAVDMQELRWDNPNGGAIDVPAGATVRINRSTVNGPIEKTGGGTLVLNGLREGSLVTVKNGRVLSGHPDPTSACEMAAGPAFHLDANDTNRMDLVSDGDDLRVSAWYDQSFGNFTFQNTATQRPVLRKGALNGGNVVDFGEWLEYGSGKYMNFGRPMDAIRSVFVVWKAQQDGGDLLGTSNENGWRVTWNTYDFAREDYNSRLGGILQQVVSNVNTYQGDIFIDGVKVAHTTKPSGDYELVDVHTVGAGAHASALGADRIGTGLKLKQGGQAYAEIIIYNRTLSARERVATRNYLRQKWFPTAALEDLPDDDSIADPPNKVERMAELDVTEDRAFATDTAAEVKRLVGASVLTKTGTGTLSVDDLGDFAGEIAVSSGTLKLSGVTGSSESFVESGRLLHLDANVGVSTELDADGFVRVTGWTSRHDSSWTAVPGYDAHKPTLRPFGKDALKAVDMAPLDECMRFRHAGDYACISNIGSVFWVIGSQYGGGHVLGGGNRHDISAAHYPFARAGVVNDHAAAVNFDPDQALLHASDSDSYLRTRAVWRRNGTVINPLSDGLSGDWDVLTLTLEKPAYFVSASGLAHDGRTFTSSNAQLVENLRSAVGKQRLAELIIYDRVLTDEERLQNEAYLRAKWGVHAASAETTAAVSIAAGATLDCGGTSQYVAALTGAGTVANGTLEAGALVADAAATDWTDVTGAFSIASGVTVDLRNLPAMDGNVNLKVRILKAAAFENVENLSTAVFTGTALPDDCRVRLVIDSEGWLCAKIRNGGTVLIVR